MTTVTKTKALAVAILGQDGRPTVTHPVEVEACEAAMSVTSPDMAAMNLAYYETVIPAMLRWVRDSMASKTLPTGMAVVISHFATELSAAVAPVIPRKSGVGDTAEIVVGDK